jgi:hypothetical protein
VARTNAHSLIQLSLLLCRLLSVWPASGRQSRAGIRGVQGECVTLQSHVCVCVSACVCACPQLNQWSCEGCLNSEPRG